MPLKPRPPFINKTNAVFQLLSRVKDPDIHPNDRAYYWEIINRYLFSGSPPAVWQNFPLITRGGTLYTKIDFVQEVLDLDAEKNALTPVEDEDYSGWDTYTFDGKAVEKSEFKEGMDRNRNFVDWDAEDLTETYRKQYVQAKLLEIVRQWQEQRMAMDRIYDQFLASRGEAEA